uniref:Glutathione peroxidase n=1 Tax=Dicentrarchus labrax TaxID=13489 RepID=A0A8P4KF03_DICLA
SNTHTLKLFLLPCSYRTSMANKSIYDFCAETLDGQQVPLSNFRGKVLLIINVATF